jgi:hypothetical protein
MPTFAVHALEGGYWWTLLTGGSLCALLWGTQYMVLYQIAGLVLADAQVLGIIYPGSYCGFTSHLHHVFMLRVVQRLEYH